MQYTTKGYRIPELDDSDFWDSIVFDINRINAHDHDGVNSQLLSPGAIGPYEEAVALVDWVGSGPFTYTLLWPVMWDMVWTSGEPCPVTATCRDSANNVVYLDQARTASGDGIIFTTYIKLVMSVGLV